MLENQIENLRIEKNLRTRGYQKIAGVDEAGCGPLAGPVVAAAVILPSDFYHSEIKDSKKMTARKRKLLYKEIIDTAETFAVGIVNQQQIDQMNIRQATLLAMRNVARQVPAASTVLDAVAGLVLASHPESESAPPLVKQFVRFGASPRAGQAIIIGAKVHALMNGRFNVALSDVEAVAVHAMRHRLILNFEGEAEGIRPSDIVAEMLQSLRQKEAV